LLRSRSANRTAPLGPGWGDPGAGTGAGTGEPALARRLFRRKVTSTASPDTWLPSHRALLAPVDPDPAHPPASGGPDLIVVSTAYSHATPRRGLRLAAEMARDCETPLLVLCSKDACSRASVEGLDKLLRDLGVVQAQVLQLTPQASPLTTFEVDGLWVSQAWRRGGARPGEPRLTVANDVGRKRNVALAAAVAMKAGTVLFLDDDIVIEDDEPEGRQAHPRTLDTVRLAAAVASIRSGRLEAVGWPAVDFDDNSVLFRIRAQMGLPQTQFIGAGALLVNTRGVPPFFPSIFNEDWLFLLGYLQRRPGDRILGEAGDVHQDWRPPYSPRRAASEELGDLLGEGLLSQVRPGSIDLAVCEEQDFWRDAFSVRRQVREDLQQQVARSGHEQREAMLEALAAIAAVHGVIEQDGFVHLRQLAGYMRTWRRDADRWSERLATLSMGGAPVSGETRPLLTVGDALEAFART
jgi:hypothetical protein